MRGATATTRSVAEVEVAAAGLRVDHSRTATRRALAALRRLTRDLESLDSSLRAAERLAVRCDAATRTVPTVVGSDVGGRLSEITRRELAVEERERATERQRLALERARGELQQAKQRLKRSMARFQRDVSGQADATAARERRLARARAELLEARRELARDRIHLKATLRDAAKLCACHPPTI